MNPHIKKKKSFEVSISCTNLKKYEIIENLEMMVMENCSFWIFIMCLYLQMQIYLNIIGKL